MEKIKAMKIDIVIISILIIIIGFLVFTKNEKNDSCDHIIKYNINYILESELKYYETKSKLVTDIQNYIESVAPTTNVRAYELVDLCEKYAIDLKFVLAQSELESLFGTKGLAAKTRSIFNLGAYDNYTYDEIHHKYKYSHPNASIEPYLKLLNERYLVNKLETDLLEEYIDKDGNRYASDENYEKKLKAKYEFIENNTSIDSLQALMVHYAIKCNR